MLGVCFREAGGPELAPTVRGYPASRPSSSRPRYVERQKEPSCPVSSRVGPSRIRKEVQPLARPSRPGTLDRPWIHCALRAPSQDPVPPRGVSGASAAWHVALLE